LTNTIWPLTGPLPDDVAVLLPPDLLHATRLPAAIKLMVNFVTIEALIFILLFKKF
jgi:hypothetical protein